MSAALGFVLADALLNEYGSEVSVEVAGTDRTTGVALEELQITYALGQPTTLSAVVVGFTPAAGQEVRVLSGGTGGECLFGGHIVSRQLATGARLSGDRKVWTLQAQDYSWLMNRYARVTAVYEALGYNSILARILGTYTDGGFLSGYVPSALGTCDRIQFTQETVWGAVERLADAAGGYAMITPDRHVHIFTSADHLPANAISFTDSSNNFADLRRVVDYSNIATRVEFEGGGSATTALVGYNSTTIPVEDTKWYSTSGGRVMANQQEITYTGKSVASGLGNLTGCTGVLRDIPQGENINVFIRVDDATAQTALAASLGGSLSGIAVHYQADGRMSLTEATGKATKILADRAYGDDTITYRTYDAIHAGARYTVPGKTVALTLTAPETITATYRIQRVTVQPRTDLRGAADPTPPLSHTVGLGVERTVTLGTELRDMDLIRAVRDRVVGAKAVR